MHTVRTGTGGGCALEDPISADPHGKVVRFRLGETFDVASVQVLDLTQTQPNLKGYCGGFAYCQEL